MGLSVIGNYYNLGVEALRKQQYYRYEQRALKLLQNPDAKYDKHQALVVCHMHKFSVGVLHLYEEQKQYQRILAYHLARRDSASVLACCRRFGHQEPGLWLQALWACVKDSTNENTSKNILELTELLPEVFIQKYQPISTKIQIKPGLLQILSVVAKERLLSPMLVVDALGTGSANVTLQYVRDYIISEIEREEDLITRHTQLTNKYKQDTDELREKIHQLKTSAVTFQGSRCSACHHQLELPSLHFLCQHSYHQHCFQSYSDNENECPACQPSNKNIVDLLKAREPSRDLHETFHSLLERTPDGFSLAAEYFGRSVFNKVTIVRLQNDSSKVPSPPIKPQVEQQKQPAVVVKKQEPVKEAPNEGRLRQTEGKSKTPTVIPIPEGRMRLQERHYGGSLEANLIRVSPKSTPKESPRKSSDMLSTNVVNKGASYDETKNPFFENTNPFEESTNPFGDPDEDDIEIDDDYNKNPFA